LGYFTKCNTTSLTVNYSATSVLSSIYLSFDGIYLVTFAIQLQSTTQPSSLYSNVSNTNSSTSTAGSIGISNFGFTIMQSSLYYGSNGTLLAQCSAGSYLNLTMSVSGGTSYSSPGPAIYFAALRVG